jgi:putative AlgH/UPF0301 family transcriptional regulator
MLLALGAIIDLKFIVSVVDVCATGSATTFGATIGRFAKLLTTFNPRF